MKAYKLRFLPLLEDDLNQIVDYICFHLENPKAASELVAEVFEAISRRLPCAESFEAYHERKVRRLRYYRIYVKNYIIFYVVDGHVMEVRRILYGCRDWTQLL
ncbi:MAG: type II toxin-antitoxin system RelE/ParE family toxin [Clostridiaceae bacterium]|nr:type II toxin-antitoxin system RelE/ParE family toxin [Clostridiaceae bacterium]